jgi:hypothetical protein
MLSAHCTEGNVKQPQIKAAYSMNCQSRLTHQQVIHRSSKAQLMFHSRAAAGRGIWIAARAFASETDAPIKKTDEKMERDWQDRLRGNS